MSASKAERRVVYVCGNVETLTVGMTERQRLSDGVFDAIRVACEEIDKSGYESQLASIYSDWHGGRYSEQCGIRYGEKLCGYKSRYVATLSENPGLELRELVDRASVLLESGLSAVRCDNDRRCESEKSAMAVEGKQ